MLVVVGVWVRCVLCCFGIGRLNGMKLSSVFECLFYVFTSGWVLVSCVAGEFCGLVLGGCVTGGGCCFWIVICGGVC